MRNFKRRWILDRTKYMTEPEVRELRRVVESKAHADLATGRTTWPRFWMALDLAVSAGLRVSEIAGLRIGNLHLNGIGNLNSNHSNNGEARMRVLGKGQKVRDVFISSGLMKHLSNYLLWKRLLEEPMEPEAFVLVSSHRKPYSPRTLQYAFKECLKEAGLPLHYSIHACRHSYGTILYRKTKNLRLVQKQLGHSSITTTTVYADVSAEEAVEAVNGLFEGGGGK
jgi:site-specific recombinase XerD